MVSYSIVWYRVVWYGMGGDGRSFWHGMAFYIYGLIWYCYVWNSIMCFRTSWYHGMLWHDTALSGGIVWCGMWDDVRRRETCVVAVSVRTSCSFTRAEGR